MMTPISNLKFSAQATDAIGDEFGIVGIHKCRDNSLLEQTPVVHIAKKNELVNLTWHLLLLRIATQSDVNTGEAENLDELMGASSVAIQYCPFCGIDLQKLEATSPDEALPKV